MNKRVLIEPVQQTIWQWPAVVNLICGGTACGYCLLSLIAQRSDGSGTCLASMVAPALVLIGFGAVAVESGRPSAARYLLHHLRTSWMSREVLAGSFFIFFCTLDAFSPRPALKLLSALSAGGLLFAQSMMVKRCKAVSAWDRNLNLFHFLASGIYMGFGLLLLLHGLSNQVLKPLILEIGLLASIVSLAAWHRMVLRAGDGGSLPQALEPLHDARPLTFTMGMAHIVPTVILLVLLLATVFDVDFKLLQGICIVTGIFILIGGSAQKHDIILKANLLRELTAEHCSIRLSI